jgi:hypothetical protein
LNVICRRVDYISFFIIPDYQNFNQMPDFRLVPGTSVVVLPPNTPDR